MTTSRRILILGGTSWLGGTLARIALERGHQVTCLARGESGSVPDGATLVKADRWEVGAYDGVAGQHWDAVIEVSWQPELVRSALRALADRAGHWTYVSSCSVYSDESTIGADESAATLEPWAGTGRVTIEEYGPAKVSCEAACEAAFPSKGLLIARAGLIAGHADRSDRFGYWPGRFAAITAEEAVVLVPPMESPVQVIDVEDLATWLISAAEAGTAGVFDAVTEAATFGDLFSECALATQKEPAFAVPEQEWLLAQGVAEWAGPQSLPLWVKLPDSALAWERELGLDRSGRKAGLSREKETELVKTFLGATVEQPR